MVVRKPQVQSVALRLRMREEKREIWVAVAQAEELVLVFQTDVGRL